MRKLLSSILILLFFNSCSSCYISEKDALNLAKPIITSILKYKKNTNHYPNSLMEIKNFPYNIKPLATNGEYCFEEKDDLTLYAGGFETGLSPESGFIYHFMIDFSKSRGSGAITSIFVGFRDNDSYEISYSGMPPALKQ